MEEKEISIQEILGILLSRIKLIITVTILAGVVGYSFAKFVLPLQYTASIKIYVTNGTRDQGDGNTYQISAQDQTAARSLAETYIVILDDTSVYEAISDKLIEEYELEDLGNYFTVIEEEDGNVYIPENEIKKLISMSAVNNTEVLQVTVTSEVPKFSADICKYISDLAPEIIKRTMKAGSVETVSPAKEPTRPSGPNISRYTLIGLLAGFAVSVGIAMVTNLFDNTVKSGDDIREHFGVPVLAEIPDIFMDEKGGSGKYGKY